MKRNFRHKGSTLLVVMIFLILMSLFAINSFNTSTGNLRIVGNSQARQESIAAAQMAIEKTISTSKFTTEPAAVAALPVTIDIDGDGTTDYSVRMTPAPSCYRARVLKMSELTTAQLRADCGGDSAGYKPGPEGSGGVSSEGAGDSRCADTDWNLRALVSDTKTGTSVAINQGVAVRVDAIDAESSCL